MDELVSIVITTYGRMNTLERALKSVLSQTYSNIEIIVVDDNINMSIRDSVKAIVKACANDRIRLICNENNLGGALSRNVGILNATGEYIAFLDDDDEYYPEKVEKQLMLFKKSSDERLALVYCYCTSFDENENIIQEYNYNFCGNCLYEAMLDCIAATSQWMCRKKYLLDVGCFSDVPCKQDSTVIVKLLAAGYNVDRVPVSLSKYYDYTGERISSGNPKKRVLGEEALRELCREQYVKITSAQQKEIEYSFSCKLLVYYYLVKDYKKFKREIWNIIITHPLHKRSLHVYKQLSKHLIKRDLW